MLPYIIIVSHARSHLYCIVQSIRGPKLLQFSRKPQMFSHEFQSFLALVDIVLMQMQKFFCEYSHGDLTAKALTLERFVLYGIC